MSDLLEILQERARNIDSTILLLQMGYSKPERALDRLRRLLAAPDLLSWFNQSSFDFKYSNREFILRLGELLEISSAELLISITAVQDEQSRIEKMFKSYIFIDTNFKRQNQPVFMLAILEGQRHISLSKYDVEREQLAELKRVKHIVLDHYKDNGGKLSFWGEIQRYIYVYGDDQKLALYPDGRVVSADDSQLQMATLTIGGKDITPLFATYMSDESLS